MHRKDFKLPISDVELLVHILEKIHNLNNLLLDDIIYDLNRLLSSNSIFLGVCTENNHKSTLSMEKKIPSWNSIAGALFEKKPCKKNCNDEQHQGDIINSTNNVISCKSQQGHFTSCLQLKYKNKIFQEKEKYILSIIVPYLHKAINQYHTNHKKFQSFSFTKRELDVIHWMMRGEKNCSISKVLNVSERTIKFHNNNIYKKLNVHSRLEVVKKMSELQIFLEQ